jgi:hypothetical protein
MPARRSPRLRQHRAPRALGWSRSRTGSWLRTFGRSRPCRRMRRKAAERQASHSGLAPISPLVVDLARAELTSELSHSGYRARFEEMLRERLGDDLLGYDLIAFCESHAAAARLQLHFLMSKDAIDPAAGEACSATNWRRSSQGEAARGATDVRSSPPPAPARTPAGRTAAGRRSLPSARYSHHRRLRARARDRREELGVFDMEPVLQPPRAADVHGALDRRNGRLHPPSEPVGERERAVEQLARRNDLVDVSDLRGGLGIMPGAVSSVVAERGPRSSRSPGRSCGRRRAPPRARPSRA